MNFVKNPQINQLIKDRCQFYRQRFVIYATRTGQNHNQAMNTIVNIQKEYGSPAVTAEVDKYVPAELHSSRVPQMQEAVA